MPLTGAMDLLPGEADVEGIGGVAAARQSDAKLGGWHRGQLPGRLAEVGVFRGSDLPWNERGSAKTSGWPPPASQHRRAAWPGPGLLLPPHPTPWGSHCLPSAPGTSSVFHVCHMGPLRSLPPRPPILHVVSPSHPSACLSGEAPHLGSSHVPLPTSVRSQAVAETPGCLPNIQPPQYPASPLLRC